jgi:hypothetical protein
MWSTGTGSDVMKRIAAPMGGGIFASFVLELLIYPAIYGVWRQRALRHEPGDEDHSQSGIRRSSRARTKRLRHPATAAVLTQPETASRTEQLGRLRKKQYGGARTAVPSRSTRWQYKSARELSANAANGRTQAARRHSKLPSSKGIKHSRMSCALISGL